MGWSLTNPNREDEHPHRRPHRTFPVLALVAAPVGVSDQASSSLLHRRRSMAGEVRWHNNARKAESDTFGISV